MSHSSLNQRLVRCFSLLAWNEIELIELHHVFAKLTFRKKTNAWMLIKWIIMLFFGMMMLPLDVEPFVNHFCRSHWAVYHWALVLPMNGIKMKNSTPRIVWRLFVFFYGVIFHFRWVEYRKERVVTGIEKFNNDQFFFRH